MAVDWRARSIARVDGVFSRPGTGVGWQTRGLSGNAAKIRGDESEQWKPAS